MQAAWQGVPTLRSAPPRNIEMPALASASTTSEAAVTTLSQLPRELLMLVLKQLTPADVACCDLVCRSLHAAASEQGLWQILCSKRFPSTSMLPVTDFKTHFASRFRAERHEVPASRRVLREEFYLVIDFKLDPSQKEVTSTALRLDAGERVVGDGSEGLSPVLSEQLASLCVALPSRCASAGAHSDAHARRARCRCGK